MFDNPPTPHYGLLITPYQQNVHRIALSIGILASEHFVAVKHERLGRLWCVSPYAIRLYKLPAWDTRYIPNDIAVIVKAHG